MFLEINVMYNFTLTVYPELSIAVRNIPLAFLHDASAALDPLLLVRQLRNVILAFENKLLRISAVIHANNAGIAHPSDKNMLAILQQYLMVNKMNATGKLRISIMLQELESKTNLVRGRIGKRWKLLHKMRPGGSCHNVSESSCLSVNGTVNCTVWCENMQLQRM